MNTRKILNPISRLIKRVGNWLKPEEITWKGAAYGIIGLAILIHFLVNTQYAFIIGIHYWVLFLLLNLLAAFFAGLLFNLMTGWIAKVPKLLKLAIVIAFFVSFFSFSINQQTSLFMLAALLLIASLIGSAVWKLFKGHFKQSGRRNQILILFSGLLGLAGLVLMTWWFIDPGKMLDPPLNAAYHGTSLPAHIEAKNPAEPGPYTVQTLTYGSGKDKHRQEYGEQTGVLTHTVDGSSFLDAWDGWRGKMRTRYFGFGKDSLPLNARVWFPQEPGHFPLVLIVHGNHLAQEFSDPGYAYLGRLLASRGFILASVDQNFINGSFTDLFKGFQGENDARAWLLLKHLELWQQWNNDSSSMFFQKVDLDNIALIGHSRGGEAVAHAALFNRLPHYPDNAKETFQFNFSIRSIVGIAPVDGQYKPAGILSPLKDINYLVLHGTHDADMQSYHGLRYFSRLEFSQGFEGFKAGVYIYGANHGQFNSVWGRKDFASPRINFFNLRQLIPEEQQQLIAKVLISGFLESTLKGKAAYQSMFIDHRTVRKWLPENIYLNQYASSGTQFICRYDEDLNLLSATWPEGRIETERLTLWKEKVVSIKWGDIGTRAAYIGWNEEKEKQLSDHADPESQSAEDPPENTVDALQPPANYAIHIPEGSMGDITGKTLIFLLADANEDPGNHDKDTDKEKASNGDQDKDTSKKEKKTEIRKKKKDSLQNDKIENNNSMDGEASEDTEKDKEPIDFSIELIDAEGEKLRFALSDCKYLQTAITKQMGKLPFISTAPNSETVFDFFYFPLADVLHKQSSTDARFDPLRLLTVRFVFDKTEKGVIVLNDLGFMD